MKIQRRQLLRMASGAAAVPAISRIAAAQSYPTRPITMIVPLAAGEITDVVGRVVAERMGGSLGGRAASSTSAISRKPWRPTSLALASLDSFVRTSGFSGGSQGKGIYTIDTLTCVGRRLCFHHPSRA
jgi:hypothetical protein